MKVVVTRAEGGGDRLSGALTAAGFEVAVCPLVRVVPVDGPPVRVDAYDWVVLTSPRAVELLLARAEGALPQVAVVGSGTAAASRASGVDPALVATRSTQEGLVADLKPLLGPVDRVLFAGAERARDVLVRELSADAVVLYRTEALRPASFPDAELVVLASASAARSFAALGLTRPCVSIGPVTSAGSRRAGLTVLAEAETQDADGLVAAVRLAASLLASSRS